MPEVEDDMNVKIVISSDAPELSSALIQLELNLSQAQLECITPNNFFNVHVILYFWHWR